MGGRAGAAAVAVLVLGGCARASHLAASPTTAPAAATAASVTTLAPTTTVLPTTTTTTFNPMLSCPLNGTSVTMTFSDCIHAQQALRAAAPGTGTAYSATCLVAAPHYSDFGTRAPQYTIDVTNTSQSPLTVSGFSVAFFDTNGAQVGSDVEPPGRVQVEAITPQQQQRWSIPLNAAEFPGNGAENFWHCTVLSVDTAPVGEGAATTPATVQCPTEADIIAVTPAANQQSEQLLGHMATQAEIYAIAKQYCESRTGQ